MSKPQPKGIIESNAAFGPIEFGYFPGGSEWFAQWLGARAPKSGFKMHVTAAPKFAEIVARSVLPKLRDLKAAHKVVRDLDRYIRFCQGDQAGKFITIYTSGAADGQLVLEAIDPELYDLRKYGGVLRGAIPTTRESDHGEPEIPIGRSGFIFTRWFDENSRQE